MKTLTTTDLMYAVIHVDSFDTEISSHDVEHILGIAMKKLGLAALIDPLRMDLGNGHFLNVTVEVAAPQSNPNFYDLVEHLERQQEFSLRTFGPGLRTDGVIDHIQKELKEIKDAPYDLTEWVDVVLLGLDGAWRAGYDPQEICQAIDAKLQRNIARTWPDWRTAELGKAIEHVRE